MNQLISLIVPIYNVELYLERCLKSIQNQTYSNIEVIMVNDGSSDGSPTIAKSFAANDDRFNYYEKSNGGLSSARNYGLKFVHGSLLSFIDSDDFLSSNYVKLLVEEFDDNTDIVIGDYAIYNEKNKKYYFHSSVLEPKRIRSIYEKKELLSKMFSGYPVMSVWKNMYRTSFIIENNLKFISEREVYAEDELFHVEAYSMANEIVIINEIVFFHVIVPGSLSQGYRKNYFEMMKSLRNRVLVLLEKHYDTDFVELYNKSIPISIGSAYLKCSKCGFKEAKSNIGHIMTDGFTIKAYKDYSGQDLHPIRYKILYQIGKLNRPGIVVFVAKGMLLANPIYRLFQNRKELKLEDQ